MVRASQYDSHEFIEDMEEASLLGLSSGSDHFIHSFEIEQARQNRRHSTSLLPRCSGWARLLIILSIVGNVVLTVLVIQSPEVSKDNYHTRNNHDFIYGHLHMAQTSGTDINGKLAARYEHVCGNRGYSLDYYQYNERVRNSTNYDIPLLGVDSISIISKDNTMNRGRLPFSIMQEIGFEDCDWISLEQPWKVWPDLLHTLGRHWQLELHVPCRDPLDHLLSMCHESGHDFDCRANSTTTGTTLESEIAACVLAMDRFSLELLEFHANIRLTCFASAPMDRYISYMSHRLESKRISANYVARGSDNEIQGLDDDNDYDDEYDDKQQQECLRQNLPIANQVRQILLDNYEYFRWCHECLESDHDLLAKQPFVNF